MFWLLSVPVESVGLLSKFWVAKNGSEQPLILLILPLPSVPGSGLAGLSPLGGYVMLGSAVATLAVELMKSVSKVCVVNSRKNTFTFEAGGEPEEFFRRTRAIA